MKKCISVLLAITLLMASLGCSFIVFAANSVSVDSFVESVEELNEEEAEAEKTFEESVGSRVIVKALQKPSIYGDAEYFKGTYGKHILQYSTEEEALEAVKYYKSLSYVKWAETDSIIEAQGVSSYGEAMLGTQRAKEYIANHKIPTSSIKVAVIDTGIDFNHEIFKGNPRIVDSGLNVTDTGETDSALDDFGHGSEVAEIVMDNTSEDVSIIGYKVLNKVGSGTDLWIATGIEKAVEDGVKIINLSLGGEKYPNVVGTSEVLIEAVEFAMANGVIVVGAAGNDGLAAEHFVPACIDGVIVVGAIDKAGNRAYFSNYGKEVDFVAPGVKIERDYIVPTTYQTVNGERVPVVDTGDPIDGTSFSAPFITAEIGTLLSIAPNLSRDEVVSELSSVTVPYEHLPYHDGFHPIEEDQGVFRMMRYMHDWDDDIDNLPLHYGNGMPQVDLLLEFPDGFNRTPTPSFSIDGGHYVDEELDLVLSSDSGAEIYYTQDESYPTRENGIKFEGTIHLDELQSVRAIAYCDGKAPSYFSAEEYRMEYHVLESDFTFQSKLVKTAPITWKKTTYYNVITAYNGTRKNIIFPETYGNEKVETVTIHSTNVHLTSVTIPDSIKIGLNDYNQDLAIITANGLDSCGFYGGIYPNLVELNAVNAKSVAAYGNSPIRKIYAPEATEVLCDDSPYLYSVYAPKIEVTSTSTSGGFENCYSLHDIYCPKLKNIKPHGFWRCYMLTNVTFENVEQINTDALCSTYRLKELYVPKLSKLTSCLFASGVRLLFAPKVQTIDSWFGHIRRIDSIGDYVTGCNSRVFLSSEFSESNVDAEGYEPIPNTLPTQYIFYHFLMDIYGTPNTYAEEYANKFNLKFVPLPLMESEPESMRASDSLSVDVLGFNLEYQWFGTNIADNRLGEAIEGANGETFNPDDFGADYDFYYCVIKSSDGDYHKTLVTGDRIRLDVSGDGVIDIADISLLLSMYGEAPAESFQDFNGDGVINVSEISLLLKSTVYGTKE